MEYTEEWFDKNFWSNVKSLDQLKAAIKQNYRVLLELAVDRTCQDMAPEKKKIAFLHDGHVRMLAIASTYFVSKMSVVNDDVEIEEKDCITFSMTCNTNFLDSCDCPLNIDELCMPLKIYPGLCGCSDGSSWGSFYLFLDDWPALKESVEKQIFMGSMKKEKYRLNLDELDGIYLYNDYKKVEQ